LPIVATRMPGCSDVISDGRTGFLVPPRAPRLLAAKIIDLLDDRAAARAMGARAAELVRQQFSLDLTVARYVAAYSELMDQPARSTPPAARQGAERGSLGQERFS
jgi:glycosyltransferase involved in cell wall biosynthesis